MAPLARVPRPQKLHENETGAVTGVAKGQKISIRFVPLELPAVAPKTKNPAVGTVSWALTVQPSSDCAHAGAERSVE